MDQTSSYPDPNQVRKRRVALPAFLITLALAMALLWSGGLANFPSALAQTETSTPETSASSSSIAQIADQASKAVVTITNLRELDADFSLEPQFPQEDPSGGTQPDAGSESGTLVPFAEGSGYIIDDEGHIVTNNHVIAGGEDFEVEFFDGTTAEATLVGSDDLQDVAVLKLDDPSLVPGTLSFGDSDDVEVGDDVIAIGNPFGEYPNSVTTGNVAGLDRSLDTGQGYELPNLIQHDAALYPGNSGGPLLNMDGEVVGMNVAKAFNRMMDMQDSNIGLSIESNAVKEIVDQIIQFGQAQRPYVGIRTMLTNEGIVIDSVEPDSPAADAGLEPQDVITEVDGEAVDFDNPFINEVLFDHAPGDTITLTVERDGEEQEIEVTLGQRPSDFQ
jgi:S1-C subfamily serine protease